MDYIVNTAGEGFDIILFEYDKRNWEIIIDENLSDREINLLVLKRVDELTDEFLDKKTYDYSDLIVDYTSKKEG
jgi:predicted transcriptional regulator YheO